MKFLFVSLFIFLFCTNSILKAQDTLSISYKDFIDRALALSPLVQAEKQKEYGALSRLTEARANRITPRFDISSNHGIMPGVSSSLGLPKNEWHLDPNLQNEWNDWNIFTRIDFTIAQPIFTWGALSNAIEAVKSGADVSAWQRNRQEAEQKMLYTKLYFSAVLAFQLDVLAKEALANFSKAEKQMAELEEEGDIEAKDLYKLKIYKHQFYTKADEITYSKEFVQSALNIALGTKDVVYYPTTDTLSNEIVAPTLDWVKSEALQLRPELKAVQSATKAADYALKAQKAQRLPALFFGLSGEYVHTPRPVQAQPLFGSRFDYVNVIYTFGIRQSLNFGVLNARVAQVEYRKKEAELSTLAIQQGILAEVSNAYKEFKIAESKKNKTAEALQVSKEWLRKEQIDYDLGIGEVKNLVDALKTNLELEAEFKQSLSDFNVKKATLLKATGKLQ